MALPAQLAGMFPGLQGGVGGMFVQQTGGPVNQALAGEADVMMISGVTPVDPAMGGVAPAIPAPSLTGQLLQPVQLGTFTLPMWQWLLIAVLAGGAGGYYLGRR